MSEIKPLTLVSGYFLGVLISEHPKNKCLSQTPTFKCGPHKSFSDNTSLRGIEPLSTGPKPVILSVELQAHLIIILNNYELIRLWVITINFINQVYLTYL